MKQGSLEKPLDRKEIEGHYELPAGWCWVRLGEVCELIMGQSPPGDTYTDKPEGLPFFQGKTDFGEYSPTVRIWCNQPIKIVEEGDILISVRAPVGPVNMNNLKCCIGRGLTGIRCKDSIAMNWFIFWYLRSIEKQIALLGSGSTFGAITRDDLINLGIPLPPLDEQRYLAVKIQQLMQEVKRARTACEKQLEAAKALPAAYLREIFESEGAKKWERRKLGEVCEFSSGKFIQKEKVENQGTYPVYGANGVIGFTNDKIFNKEVIVIGRVGSCGLVNKTLGPAWITDNTIVLQPFNQIIFDFLYWTLKSLKLEELRAASVQPLITQKDLKVLIMHLPPLPVQQHIAAELQEKMAQVERLSSAIRNQQSVLDALPQAIFRKAFRGEL